MTEQIKELFERNIELVEITDKAVFSFRTQEYEEALELLSGITEKLKPVIALISANTEAFPEYNVENLMQMLEEVLIAGKNSDYVLIADLLEMRLTAFIFGIQKKIMEMKGFEAFSDDSFRLRCIQMAAKIEHDQSEEAASALFEKTISPAELLEKGYRVEFTACGLMTVAAGNKENSVYLHTNNSISAEAGLLARKWSEKGIKTYVVSGFGFGYHVRELALQNPEAYVEVYEKNAVMLKLACAFTDFGKITDRHNIKLFYDPDGKLLETRRKSLETGEKLCIHLPSKLVSEMNA